MGAATKDVNLELASKHRELAGIKLYVTSRLDDDPMVIIGYYRRLFQIERSFRMAKSDLAARPIFHTKKDSIDAHLTVVMAAMAVGRWIESVTGMSIKRFVRELRVHREVRINVGGHEAVAASPLPEGLSEQILKIRRRGGRSSY